MQSHVADRAADLQKPTCQSFAWAATDFDNNKDQYLCVVLQIANLVACSGVLGVASMALRLLPSTRKPLVVLPIGRERNFRYALFYCDYLWPQSALTQDCHTCSNNTMPGSSEDDPEGLLQDIMQKVSDGAT